MRKLTLLLISSFQLLQAGKPLKDYKSNNAAAQELVSFEASPYKIDPAYKKHLWEQVFDWNITVTFPFKNRIVTTCPLAAMGLLRKHSLFSGILANKTTNPNFSDEYGFTPLHTILDLGEEEQGEYTIIRRLLGHEKIDLEAQTIIGATPIMVAAWAGKTGDFFELRTAGANIHAVNMHGITVKDYARVTSIFAADCFQAIFEEPPYPPRNTATPEPREESASPLSESFTEELEHELIRLGLDRSPGFIYPKSPSPSAFASESPLPLTYGTFAESELP